MAGLFEARVSPESFLLLLTLIDFGHILEKGKEVLVNKSYKQVNEKKVKYKAQYPSHITKVSFNSRKTLSDRKGRKPRYDQPAG